MPAFAELDQRHCEAGDRRGGTFAAEVLAPTNARGDSRAARCARRRGAHAAGFREAYRAFVDAGWPTLACAPGDGGQGLPQVLNAALYEMLRRPTTAGPCAPACCTAPTNACTPSGRRNSRRAIWASVASGEWLSTMCLTEAMPAATSAWCAPAPSRRRDGSCRLHGNKIFISGGDHDLTDNIVHLVLAPHCRRAGRDQGTVAVRCARRSSPTARAMPCTAIGIEKKMGIHGSATCAMSFEGAQRLARRRAQPRPGRDVRDDERRAAACGLAGHRRTLELA